MIQRGEVPIAEIGDQLQTVNNRINNVSISGVNVTTFHDDMSFPQGDD